MSNAQADLGSESGDLDTHGNNGNGNGNKYGDVKIVRIKKVNFVSMAKELMFVAPMNTLNYAEADSEFDSYSDFEEGNINIDEKEGNKKEDEKEGNKKEDEKEDKKEDNIKIVIKKVNIRKLNIFRKA